MILRRITTDSNTWPPDGTPVLALLSTDGRLNWVVGVAFGREFVVEDFSRDILRLRGWVMLPNPRECTIVD